MSERQVITANDVGTIDAALLEPAPEGMQWMCRNCGHHAKTVAEIPGVCDHDPVLANESAFEVTPNP